MTFGEKLKQIRNDRGLSQQAFADMLRTSKQVISRYELGQTTPKIGIVSAWCQILGVSLDSLINDDKPVYSIQSYDKYPEPRITDDIVTLPVIGEVAAGYEHIALEDWSGETVDVPASYLHGRPKSDYMVLTVKGDSMYPMYLEGDKVLVLKQATLNRSGEIGLVRYDGENATLKKVEYVDGEDWMKLLPLNPEYPPKMITGANLEQCAVIGIPKLIIREVA